MSAERPPAGLAAVLRAATADVHADLECRLASTLRPANRDGYAACLARHYTVFLTLEPPMAASPAFAAAGIDVRAHRRLPDLRADLSALGVDLGRLAALPVPPPGAFPAALGTLYALEGSSLGGQVILREAKARFGGEIAGATAFFGGNALRPAWPAFKAKLDAYGAAHPAAGPAVVAGAAAAFAVFGRAFGRQEALF